MLYEHNIEDGLVIKMNPPGRLPPVNAAVVLKLTVDNKPLFCKAVRTAYASSYISTDLHYRLEDESSSKLDPIRDSNGTVKLGKHPWVYHTCFDYEKFEKYTIV